MTQGAKESEAELHREGFGIQKWVSAVTERENESEAELHNEGLDIQKELHGSVSTCQREQSRATQRGARCPEVVIRNGSTC